ncbi:hypothetical protein POTOM_000075 [Populus tomentosa]|uniref:Uncharacterized protein n=1 Tax=Populus tomentosa TaxID=118781 RepID=A0A8X8AMD3_POPTO|nr:hypothetical protein POTOM_000075 [Populus tomentosa]
MRDYHDLRPLVTWQFLSLKKLSESMASCNSLDDATRKPSSLSRQKKKKLVAEIGSLIGHVSPGMAFFMLGLWHLFNHVKLHSLHPNSYTSSLWFPVTRPRTRAKAKCGLTHLLGAAAFGQQLLMFHLHSTDHKGLEGQYHLPLQLVVSISLVTTLMGIGFPRSFLVSFVRSLSVLFQGVWFMVMGFMLWTPRLIPKGCSLYNDDGHKILRCASEEALHRAKSLVNIQFGWLVVGLTIFAITLYLHLVEKYSKNVKYSSLAKEFEEMPEDCSDIET